MWKRGEFTLYLGYIKKLLCLVLQRGVIWLGSAWFGLAWFGLVWFRLVWFWFGSVCFGLVLVLVLVLAWFGVGVGVGLIWLGLVYFGLFKKYCYIFTNF